ncbi:methyltransferase domain-containing protein [Litoricola sp.]|nr:methyltransferase domain-containing protein [Litorivicinus sp.]
MSNTDIENRISAAIKFKSLRENHISSFSFMFRKVSSSFLLPRIARFINKYFYKIGLGAALNRYDNTITLYSAFADNKLYQEYNSQDLFCNFGSGAFFHKRWLNYDFPGQSKYYKNMQGKEGRDFYPIDLCEDNLKLPLSDNSVSLIYCSHTLEHIEESYAIKFISECYRVLKKNGVMRIVVPSTDQDHKIISVLNSQNSISKNLKQEVCKSVAIQILADSSAVTDEKLLNLMESCNYSSSCFYEECISNGVSNKFEMTNPERHITYWDYNKLMNVGNSVDFLYCVPLYRGSSVASPFRNLNVFDNTESHSSLYFEMIK